MRDEVLAAFDDMAQHRDFRNLQRFKVGILVIVEKIEPAALALEIASPDAAVSRDLDAGEGLLGTHIIFFSKHFNLHRSGHWVGSIQRRPQ
jgi:hypothetical protein